MQETEESQEEGPRKYLRNSIYAAVYSGLSREDRLKVVACIHQHREDIQRAFENEFPSYCRDTCPLEEGIMFCSAVFCLLKDNDTCELVKTAGRTSIKNEGLLETIDTANSKGIVERKLMSVEDWQTMAEVQRMQIPEDNPLLDYKL
ncbi:MAG: hypothetical protein ABH840_03765 [Nanoarchaeota archaeon]